MDPRRILYAWQHTTCNQSEPEADRTLEGRAHANSSDMARNGFRVEFNTHKNGSMFPSPRFILNLRGTYNGGILVRT